MKRSKLWSKSILTALGSLLNVVKSGTKDMGSDQKPDSKSRTNENDQTSRIEENVATPLRDLSDRIDRLANQVTAYQQAYKEAQERESIAAQSRHLEQLNEQQRNRVIHKWSAISGATLTGGTLVVLVCTLCVYSRQANIMNTQANIMATQTAIIKGQFDATVPADIEYFGVSCSTAPRPLSPDTGVAVSFKNNGQSTAYEAVLFFHPRPIIELTPKQIKEVPISQIGPSNIVTTLPVNIRSEWSSEQIAAINASQDDLRLYAEVNY
jgi:TolA-binding protein